MRTATRKYCGLATLTTAALLLVGNVSWADNNKGNEAGDDRAVRLIKVIPVPGTTANLTNGKLYSFDISWVDQKSQLYFLADRSNAVVDVVDAKTGTFMGQIPGGFAGVGLDSSGAVSTAVSGPNGVVTEGHCLFVTDFTSGKGGRVVSFDLDASFPPPVVSSVFTGGVARADELAFDRKDNLILAINNADPTPFGTFVKVTPSSCVLTPPISANKVLIDTAHGVDAENGAEQPVWDGDTGLFYLSIPQIGSAVSHGGVVSIPPNGTKWTVLGSGIDFCGPAGLPSVRREIYLSAAIRSSIRPARSGARLVLSLQRPMM